ncbi:molybdopterin-containing oxidoreductase family protein [Geomonas azotofigens]|uniref:molybdopterin-containing oxidoreductase family protein n=1 Tax=Geomonas azotofigens TaxID=2843196 RepID=UPI001C111A92|nr:molybdopterin-dependent oxidoreductase [Geomonas azotofigens]MBU5613850.1 molybdopterin-dependent oxidoreductase [Geomonas azotofigens]
MSQQTTREIINGIRGTKTVPGVCMICPWHCPTENFVKDGRIEYVRGNEYAANRTTRCVKGISSIHSSRDKDRLLYPMKRNSAGVHERISWDQALTEIAGRLKKIKDEFGPESLVSLFHLDSNEMFTHQLFGHLYGSPNLSGHGAACDQDRRLAALSTFAHPLPVKDYANSRFVMLWGADPFGPNEALHENRELLEAMKRGCRLIVVDPNRSRTAEKAHIWLPIKPGTDGALALAIAHRIVETQSYDKSFCDEWVHGLAEFSEHVLSNGYTPQWAEGITGIAKETIIAVADEFAATKPALMDGLKGLVNYTTGLDALRTVFALNVITGNIDGPGNLILKEMSPLGFPLEIPEEEATIPEKPPIAYGMGYPLAPDLPTQLLPKAVLEDDPYPVKALFFHVCNPAMSDPNTRLFEKMMAAVELSVTVDIYMSETAQLSEYVLPEASTYERAEVRESMWAGPQTVLAQPAIAPLGESRPYYEIIKGLAEKMGYGAYFAWDSWEDWARTCTAYLPVPYEELKEKGVWEGELRYRKYNTDGVPTSTGKFEVYSTMFEEMGYHPLPVFNEEHRVKPDADYPFQLVNCKMQYHCGTHTQNNPYLMAIVGENYVEINSLDAARLDVREGDLVEVASPHARATIRVRTSEAVQPGVARVPHGHGFGRRFGSIARGRGTHINPLFETRANPVSGGISFNECKVKITKA